MKRMTPLILIDQTRVFVDQIDLSCRTQEPRYFSRILWNRLHRVFLDRQPIGDVHYEVNYDSFLCDLYIFERFFTDALAAMPGKASLSWASDGNHTECYPGIEVTDGRCIIVVFDTTDTDTPTLLFYKYGHIA